MGAARRRSYTSVPPRNSYVAPKGLRQGYAANTVGNLHISVWTEGPTLLDVEHLHADLDAIVDRFGSVSVLLVVEPDTPLAKEGPRYRAAEMLTDLGSTVTSVAVVIEGTGVWAKAIRSVFSGIALAIRPTFAWKTFGSVGAASTWQMPNVLGLGNPVARDDVLQAVEALRSELSDESVATDGR